QHVTDESNPQFAQIKTTIDRFKPEIILIGDVKPINDENRIQYEQKIRETTWNDIIAKRADIGFILKLALEKNLPWKALEPTDESVMEHLLTNGYTKSDIFTWKIMRDLIQYQQIVNKPNIFNYITQSIENFKTKTSWNGFEYSTDTFLENVKSVL